MKKLLLATGMALALSTSSMFGGQITDPSIPAGTITAPGTFDFAAFDPALGTLTAITVNIGDTVIATLDVFNPTSAPLTFTSASASVPFALTFTGGGGVFDFSGMAADNTGGTVAAGMLFMQTVTQTGSTSFGITPFTGYIGGPGTFTPIFTLASGGAATITGVGSQSLLYGGTATGSVTASITYTYTTPTGTPEPATMTLFGSALLGIGFFARKHVRK
jgi:PEP-CTERM motif